MSDPGPHTLTVGELRGMLAGFDPAAFTDCAGITRDAGKIIQYSLAPHPETLIDDAREELSDIHCSIRRELARLAETRAACAVEEKRLDMVRKTLRGLALLRAARPLPIA